MNQLLDPAMAQWPVPSETMGICTASISHVCKCCPPVEAADYRPQVTAKNAIQSGQTGQLPTSVQFKITDPADVQPSVRLLEPC